MSEPTPPEAEPYWRVRIQRAGLWEYVMDGPKDLLNPPEPREFGVRYRAALEGAAQLLHGVEAVEIERNPQLTPTTNGTDPH